MAAGPIESMASLSANPDCVGCETSVSIDEEVGVALVPSKLVVPLRYCDAIIDAEGRREVDKVDVLALGIEAVSVSTTRMTVRVR